MGEEAELTCYVQLTGYMLTDSNTPSLMHGC